MLLVSVVPDKLRICFLQTVIYSQTQDTAARMRWQLMCRPQCWCPHVLPYLPLHCPQSGPQSWASCPGTTPLRTRGLHLCRYVGVKCIIRNMSLDILPDILPVQGTIAVRYDHHQEGLHMP
jgi:hypothetical protein